MSDDLLTFNGINGLTGSYLVPRMTVEDLGKIAVWRSWDQAHLNELKNRDLLAKQAVFALRPDRSPLALDESGWGVIFPANAPEKQVAAIRAALGELLELRQKQAGARYKLYYHDPDPLGYINGESKDDFLTRNGAGPGTVDSDIVPYYLLIVGDPQSIPFRFQYELDVQYAVGRIYFESLDEYASYAHSVVLCEGGNVQLARKAVFFGPSNPGDGATALSAEMLVAPLKEYVEETEAKEALGWQTELVPPAEATKANLQVLLGGSQTPALLFTASHGMGFPRGHSFQRPFQGALLCQDWPGPDVKPGALSRDFYLGAEDIPDSANLLGLVSLNFACFGGGTPYFDDYYEQAFSTPTPIADYAFLAALPTRLLGHPRGGALAAVGHIERAWSYSFKWKQAGTQTSTFKAMLYELLQGKPVGLALDPMNLRYAELATMLSNNQAKLAAKKPDLFEMAFLWTANNDARGYALMGDPAVRLPLAPKGTLAPARPEASGLPAHPGVLPSVLVATSMPAAGAPEAPGVAPLPGGALPAAPPGTAFTVLDGLASMSRYAAQGESFVPGMDAIKQVLGSLTEALKSLSGRLADFTQEVTSLEVTTYVAEDLEGVTYDPHLKRFTGGATPRARTHVDLDGDTQACVPVQAGDLDESLWAIHTAMVAQAAANRTALVQAATEMLASLLGVPKA